MQNNQIPPLDALIKLLSDHDEIARIAMVQLMHHYSAELDHILLQLHECSDPLLRKRSHQMQAINTFRKRRSQLHNIIHRRRRDFFMSDALLYLHLVWFEKDSATEMTDYYQAMLDNFDMSNAENPFAVTEFLKELQFIPAADSTANCDLYMLGTILDTRYGANSALCALAIAANEDIELPHDLQIIRFDNRFFLYHRESDLLCDILDHWSVRQRDFSGYTVFDRSQLIKFMGGLCFCNAVHDDAFRYVQILADILNTNHDPSILPYPYCGRKEKD